MGWWTDGWLQWWIDGAMNQVISLRVEHMVLINTPTLDLTVTKQQGLILFMIHIEIHTESYKTYPPPA